MHSAGVVGVSEIGIGTLLNDLKQLTMPYAVYQNPYTGYFYATDAGSFAAAGQLVQWSPEGRLLGKHKVYINPGHLLALPPDGQQFSGIREIVNGKSADGKCFDLQGRRVATPQKGHVYLRNGRKILAH
jgi:hypothetical protein